MDFKIDKSIPICPQICDQIAAYIALGELKPNSKLMSVREIAINAGVNPNTVQKSLEQLEAQGLIYSVRGSGWFVANNTHHAQMHIESLARLKTNAYFSAMAQLGFTEADIINYIKEWIK